MSVIEKLAKKVRDKGFDAYFYEESRKSGDIYYIVAVDDDTSGTVGEKLKSAGFDCYPVSITK